MLSLVNGLAAAPGSQRSYELQIRDNSCNGPAEGPPISVRDRHMMARVFFARSVAQVRRRHFGVASVGALVLIVAAMSPAAAQFPPSSLNPPTFTGEHGTSCSDSGFVADPGDPASVTLTITCSGVTVTRHYHFDCATKRCLQGRKPREKE